MLKMCGLKESSLKIYQVGACLIYLQQWVTSVAPLIVNALTVFTRDRQMNLANFYFQQMITLLKVLYITVENEC